MYSHRYVQFRFRIGSGESNVAMFLLLLSILLLTMLFSACTDTPPADPVIDPPPPVQRDTTSHDFVWEVDTIGLPFGMINDVSIVSENDIWVVGQFDQLGDDGKIDYSKRRAAAHWDGTSWSLVRVDNGSHESSGQMYRVFSVDSRQTWFMSVDGFHRADSIFTYVDIYSSGFKGAVNAIWISANLSTRIFVGNNSSVAFWQSGRYLRPLSLVPGDYTDITGKEDGSVYLSLIKSQSRTGAIVQMTREGIMRTPIFEHHYPIHYLALAGDSLLFGTTHSINKVHGETAVMLTETKHFIHGLDANGLNDYFALTFPFEVLHYNGSTLQDIAPPYSFFFRPSAFDVKDDVVAVVGDGPEQRSLIFRGKRRK